MGPAALGGIAGTWRAGPALGVQTPLSRVREVDSAALPEEASVLQVRFWGLGEPGLCQVHELISHMTVCQERRGTELMTGAAPRPNLPQGQLRPSSSVEQTPSIASTRLLRIDPARNHTLHRNT